MKQIRVLETRKSRLLASILTVLLVIVVSYVPAISGAEVKCDTAWLSVVSGGPLYDCSTLEYMYQNIVITILIGLFFMLGIPFIVPVLVIWGILEFFAYIRPSKKRPRFEIPPAE